MNASYDKPFSPASDRNWRSILDALRPALADCRTLLEIGSGTGQHAVTMGAQLPQTVWQTSDLEENHPGIQAWIDEAKLPNVLPPLTLDMRAPAWPPRIYDAVYSANTLHIMGWPEVETLFAGVPGVLRSGGVLAVYGPFNYGGQFTSPSNAEFEAMLRSQFAHRGIRDYEKVNALAERHGLVAEADHALPANNRLLVWRRR